MKAYHFFLLVSALFACAAAWTGHLGGNFAEISIAWAVLTVAAVLEEALVILRRLDSREHH